MVLPALAAAASMAAPAAGAGLGAASTFGLSELLPLIGGALAGGVGGIFGGDDQPKETKLQRQRRKLTDELLKSLRSGQGAFSDLFTMDEESFKKGFADPAMSRFRNEIAPQIRQQYINSGMQRGTGLDDALGRAGVDLENLINQNLLQYQQGALNRKQGLLSAILGGSANEAPAQRSTGEAFGQGVSGYLTSDAFGKQLDNIVDKWKRSGNNNSQYSGGINRKGYIDDSILGGS